MNIAGEELPAHILPILNIFVLHLGHVPCTAGLPFFMVICLASFISLFALHFMQYPSTKFITSLNRKRVCNFFPLVTFHLHDPDFLDLRICFGQLNDFVFRRLAVCLF
jgi:hypothetical protein